MSSRAMLTISGKQLRRLEEDVVRRFAEEIAQDLRDHHEEVVVALDESSLEGRVLIGIRRAQEHGLQQRAMIGLFVEAMFLVAPNFDEYPPIRRRLGDRRFTPDVGMERVASLTTEEQWQGAERRADSTIWDRASGG